MMELVLSMAASVSEMGEKAAEAVANEPSLAEKMGEAAIHTLLGMGIVFLVLIVISFIIYLLSFTGKTKRKKPHPESEVLVTKETENTENLSSDSALVAVIAAAIAAYENTGTDQFRVTSIRKTTTKNILKRGLK